MAVSQREPGQNKRFNRQSNKTLREAGTSFRSFGMTSERRIDHIALRAEAAKSLTPVIPHRHSAPEHEST